MIERLVADRDGRNASGGESRPAKRPRRGETAKRNVEIKVFASYSNATCGAFGMNRVSFVGLERVGGAEI